ncbi:MAG: hypothetical protein HY059_09040 [Proteobacteria bacterium]|nr:hypothetical protein [Pseudomonadota bacterium]
MLTYHNAGFGKIVPKYVVNVCRCAAAWEGINCAADWPTLTKETISTVKSCDMIKVAGALITKKTISIFMVQCRLDEMDVLVQ